MDKIKLLIGSDSPYYPTGFATQMSVIAEHFGKKKDYDVHYLGWQTIGDFQVEGSSYQIHEGRGRFGMDSYSQLFNKLMPDILLTLGDAHMTDILSKASRPFWLGYYPLDGHPVSSYISNVIKTMDIRIAMSRYGQALTNQLGLDAEYMQHGVDTNQFKPVDKEEARDKIGFPQDAFIVGCIARLNPRKHHMRLLEAFKMFSRKVPEARLYLHMDVHDPLFLPDPNHRSMFLELIDTLGLNDKVIFPDQMDFLKGVPREALPTIYSALDVHALATGGEGFGVTTIEAMACKIPSVITNYSTSMELIGLDNTGQPTKYKRGTLVDPKRLQMEPAGVQKAWVDIPKFAAVLKKYYKNPRLVEIHGKNARIFTKQEYDWSVILPKWDRLLETVNHRVEVFKTD